MATETALVHGTAADSPGVRRAATATGWIAAPPAAVFALITDVDRLPEWNRAIEDVRERPGAMLPGAEWVVTMHPPRYPRWRSRSTCLEIDAERGVFAYRTRTDDGNPSWAGWRWEITPEAGGSRVSVSYDLNPRTWWRTRLFSRMRTRDLSRTEIPQSLAAIASALATGSN